MVSASEDLEDTNISSTYSESPITTDQKFIDIQNEINNLEEDSTLTLNTSHYSGNDSIRIDKSITIDGCGAILDGENSTNIFKINADNVIIKNINFIDCRGAIYSEDSLTNYNIITIDNCNFTNCNQNEYESLIYSNCTIKIYNSNFNNCFIKSNEECKGAVIYLEDCTESEIINCTFNDCISEQNASTLLIQDSECKILNCNFTNCDSDIGTIYGEGFNCILSNLRFENCTGNNSGAIYWAEYEIDM